jgi:hypothetical protein
MTTAALKETPPASLPERAPMPAPSVSPSTTSAAPKSRLLALPIAATVLVRRGARLSHPRFLDTHEHHEPNLSKTLLLSLPPYGCSLSTSGPGGSSGRKAGTYDCCESRTGGTQVAAYFDRLVT